jgi:hypothetical protein
VPNHVEAFSPDGQSLSVVFETATPFETPGWMKELVRQLVQPVGQRTNAPLVDSDRHFYSCAFGDPSFQRWQRAAFSRPHHAAMAACWVRVRLFLQLMESEIEANKDNDYLALRRAQQTIRQKNQNWRYWLVFFLRTMVKQKKTLVKEEQAQYSSLLRLSRQILQLAKTRGEITVKEIEESTGANRNAIKGAFAKAGKRQLSGAGRHGPWGHGTFRSRRCVRFSLHEGVGRLQREVRACSNQKTNPRGVLR